MNESRIKTDVAIVFTCEPRKKTSDFKLCGLLNRDPYKVYDTPHGKYKYPKQPRFFSPFIFCCLSPSSPTQKHIIWVFPKIGVPQNGWFIMENPIKMDDLGVPLFSETSIF